MAEKAKEEKLKREAKRKKELKEKGQLGMAHSKVYGTDEKSGGTAAPRPGTMKRVKPRQVRQVYRDHNAALRAFHVGSAGGKAPPADAKAKKPEEKPESFFI